MEVFGPFSVFPRKGRYIYTSICIHLHVRKDTCGGFCSFSFHPSFQTLAYYTCPRAHLIPLSDGWMSIYTRQSEPISSAVSHEPVFLYTSRCRTCSKQKENDVDHSKDPGIITDSLVFLFRGGFTSETTSVSADFTAFGEASDELTAVVLVLPDVS